MNTSSVVAGIPTSKQGLNYLVPTLWWNQFCLLNKSTSETSALEIPLLCIADHTDCFLMEYKEHLQEEIEFKSNHLKLSRLRINLEIQKNLNWTPINPALWKIINKKNKDSNGVMTIVEKVKKQDFLNLKQVQIIYCSKNKSEGFVGFLPKNANLALSVRQIGYQMGFVEIFNSKIVFLDKNAQVSFLFSEVQKFTLQSAHGSTFMAFNLQSIEQQEDWNDMFDRLANESNEAVVGDLNTMQDDNINQLNQNININNRTISTGAQTPFSFVFSQGFDLDRQYRVKQLFGAKQPEEVAEMIILASKKIYNEKQLVNLPDTDQQKMQAYLDRLADDLIQGLVKKKAHKQKEIEQLTID